MKQIKLCMMFAAAAIMLGAGIASAAPEVVTLKIAHFLPP
jgi:hypothetical protein